MAHDYGFDLPDVRHEFYTKQGGKVSVEIVRHWRSPVNDDDCDFVVSFRIIHRGASGDIKTAQTSIGCRQDEAIRMAHELYQQDDKTTRELNELGSIEDAERRFGA